MGVLSVNDITPKTIYEHSNERDSYIYNHVSIVEMHHIFLTIKICSVLEFCIMLLYGCLSDRK